jgi:hypothetical protein
MRLVVRPAGRQAKALARQGMALARQGMALARQGMRLVVRPAGSHFGRPGALHVVRHAARCMRQAVSDETFERCAPYLTPHLYE